MLKKASSLALSLVILLCFAVYPIKAKAESSEIMPCWNNTSSTSFTFSISNSGTAKVSLSCIGEFGVTTKIVAYSYIEMQIGSSWVRISNGQPNSQWTDTVTSGYELDAFHSMYLSSSGTYRAVVNFYVYGNGGATDIIGDSRIKTYSKS